MATTIQISETTRQLLASLQKKSNKSCDQIIHEMLEERTKSPSSLAGSFPDLKWSKKDRMRFDGE